MKFLVYQQSQWCLLTFSAWVCFIQSSSEFTQAVPMLKSKTGLLSPKVWACERENPSCFLLVLCEEGLLLQQ